MTSSVRLTIAIPTYNRNQTLLKNIQGLLPQLTAECQLLVIDNVSDTPVAQTLKDTLARFPNINYELVRNRANVGGNANIMRCLELCETEWVWILGDDDEVKPDAIETILAHTRAHPECLLLNFTYDGSRAQTFKTRGLNELVERLDNAADLPWISSNIYNARALSPNLNYGYQYTYSMLPHVVTLLVTVGENGVCCLSKEQIVNSETRFASVDQQWSVVSMALGFPTLLDLPFKPQIRMQLVEKLLRTNNGDGIHLPTVAYQLLLMSIKGSRDDQRSALYFYDQVCGRRYYFDTTLKRTFEMKVLRVMIKFPRLANFAYRLTRGKDFGAQADKMQDRFKRL